METLDFKDNGYLKKKGIDEFTNHNIVNFKNDLLIPYTNFEIYPEYCGARTIGPEGRKGAIKGSTLKNAFHIHRYNPEITMYILGEGYHECCVAKNLFPEFNVLEVGPCNNVKNILAHLATNADNTIYVLGEHGSEKAYTDAYQTFPTINLTYPPDKSCKDFGDYFVKYGIDKTRESLLGLLTEQKELGYIPLGIEDVRPVFYSKIINTIVKKSPEERDALFRLCTNAPWTAHKVKKDVKETVISKLFMECAQSGTYTPDNVLPVGLWRYKKKYFYNDGNKVLVVEKENLKQIMYSQALKTDFLLHKVTNAAPIDIMNEFKAAQELTNLILLCDWVEPLYAKIFLGFLVQSYYAGSIQFRPHLWLMSDSSHAGKSWLSTWCTDYLVTNAFKRESGRSTSAGTAQAMSSLAGLLAADEFAEEGSAYNNDARKMIELLRSASTAQAPIVLGSPDQKPIRGHVKFSALLACIEGESLLKKQDFDRIIIIKFGKKKGNFEKDALPKFDKFIQDDKHLGFAAHAIKGWYLYDEIFHDIHVRLVEKYPEIGHKVRGLASIIAGYAVLHRNKGVVEEFLRELHQSKIIIPYILKREVVKEDMLETILRTTITDKYIATGDNSFKTTLAILKEASDNQIKALGMVLDLKKGQLKIYNCNFKNYIEKHLKLSIHFVYSQLRRSKYYIKDSNSYFDKRKTIYFLFDLKDYILERDEEKELLKK